MVVSFQVHGKQLGQFSLIRPPNEAFSIIPRLFGERYKNWNVTLQILSEEKNIDTSAHSCRTLPPSNGQHQSLRSTRTESQHAIITLAGKILKINVVGQSNMVPNDSQFTNTECIRQRCCGIS